MSNTIPCSRSRPKPARAVPAARPQATARRASRWRPPRRRHGRRRARCRPSPARPKFAAAAPSIVRRNPRAGLPERGSLGGRLQQQTLAWCGKWHHDDQHARRRRPVLGPGRARNQRQLQRVAGVHRVWVNPVSGSTTVVYDPAETSLAAIQAVIEDCGFRCAGEALPRHVCEEHPMPGRSLRHLRPARSSPRVPR